MNARMKIEDYQKHPVTVNGECARPACWDGPADTKKPGCAGCIYSVLNDGYDKDNNSRCEIQHRRFYKPDGTPRPFPVALRRRRRFRKSRHKAGISLHPDP